MGAGMRRVGLAGAASGELGDGVVQLRPEDAMVEAMLRGWRAQQAARGLRADTAGYRERLVRRFQAFTNEFPWQWRPADVDEWTLTLTAERHLAPATIRGYQTDLRLFSEYLTDARYGWAVACEEAFGTFPVPICHEWNTIAHLNDYEGSPEARPLSREELQRFLDYADDQVERAVKARRKGVLAAYRDATLFKVIYGWGLRRTETTKLDLLDWGRNPAAAEFGRYGMLHVRYGKAVRGQPRRRRNVCSVMGWAVDAVADYVDNIRPRVGVVDHPALWVTERGARRARKRVARCTRGRVRRAGGRSAPPALIEPLARRGIRLSSSQVYRLAADRPERLSLKILMALLDILDCSMSELIEPVAAGE